jgi:hypothetical protein
MSATASSSSNSFSNENIVLLFGVLGGILLLIALLLVGTGARISIGVFLCLIGAAICGAVVIGVTEIYLKDGTSDYTYRMAGGIVLLVLSLLLMIGLYGWFGWGKHTSEIVGIIKTAPHEVHRHHEEHHSEKKHHEKRHEVHRHKRERHTEYRKKPSWMVHRPVKGKTYHPKSPHSKKIRAHSHVKDWKERLPRGEHRHDRKSRR